MKPFVYYTSLVLALLFLTLAALTWIDVFNHGQVFSNPLLTSAAGTSVTGLMFLGMGLRGWRSRRRNIQSGNQPSTN